MNGKNETYRISSDDLTQVAISSVRERIMDSMIVAIGLLGIPALVASLLRAKDFGWNSEMFVHVAATAIFLLVAVARRRLPVRFRLLIPIVVLLGLGISDLLIWGLVGADVYFFTLASAMAVVPYGVRAGAASIVVSLVAVAAIGLATCKGWITLNFDTATYARTPSSWISMAVDFGLFTAVLVVCLGRLHASLGDAIAELNDRRARLLESNQRLEQEIIEHTRTEEALRESDSRFRTVLENSLDVAYRRDILNGKPDYLSPVIEQLTGMPIDEIVSGGRKAFHARIHPDDLPAVLEDIERTQSAARLVSSLEYRFLHKDGQYRWFADRATILTDEQGLPLYRVGIIRDVTDYKRTEQALRESESILRSFFDSSGLMRGVVEVEGEDILHVSDNAVAAAMYGQTKESMRGRRETELGVAPDVIKLWIGRYQESQHTGQSVSFEYYQTCNGRPRWLNATVTYLGAGQNPRFAFCVLDITDRKLAEEALHRTHDELERRVQERTIALQQSQQQLTAINEALEQKTAQLRAMASELTLTEERERRRLATDLHDGLGQMLTLANIKLTLHRQGGQSPESLKEVEQIIDKAARAARSMTLHLSHPGLYDLGFAEAAEWLSEDIREQYGLHVELEDDGQPKVIEESVRVILYRCLRELLINAAKYANVKKATVRIRRKGGLVHILVADRGTGFDMSAVGLAGKREGFGLFSIRERIGYISGRVQIRSTLGKGTCVIMEAPLEESGLHKPASNRPKGLL